MSSPNSPTPSPTRRPRRPSKFIEGSALVGPELLQRTPTSNEHFMKTLAMEDAMEKQRRHKHRDSNSSVESFSFSNASPPTSDYSMPKAKEGRRSINFDDRPKMMQSMEDAEKVVKKFKGRLRALTGGSSKDVQPYPGT